MTPASQLRAWFAEWNRAQDRARRAYRAQPNVCTAPRRAETCRDCGAALDGDRVWARCRPCDRARRRELYRARKGEG